MAKQISNPILTPFDRAVVAVVKELLDTRHEHGLFKYKHEILSELKIPLSNWSATVKGERGVPYHAIDHIRKVLIERYKVRPAFLDNHNGEMFREVVRKRNHLEDEQAHYGLDDRNYLDRTEAIIRGYKREIERLEETIKVQKELIEELKKGKH